MLYSLFEGEAIPIRGNGKCKLKYNEKIFND
jgi:hypothetical protein